MPEKIDFSNINGQEKFNGLSGQEQSKIIEDDHENALEVDRILMKGVGSRLESVYKNPDFTRLLPAYVENLRHKSEIKKPVVHGTGSYALKKILSEGFVPQKGQEALMGENSSHRTYMESGDINPLCFAVPDDNGERVSHWYATLPCRQKSLSIDSDQFLDSRTKRLFEGAYGGMDAVVSTEMLKELKQFEISDKDLIEKTKQEVQKDIECKLINRMRESANVFDQEKSSENLKGLEMLLSGELKDIDEVSRLLRELNLLDNFRSNKDGQKLPKYKTGEIVAELIRNLSDSSSWEYNQIDQIKKEIENKLQKYKSFSREELEAIGSQFPCYITLEGENLNLKESPWLKISQEMQSFEVIPPEAIKEIQVPESKIEEIKSMLMDFGLGDVRIVPFEFYEMKEIIKHT